MVFTIFAKKNNYICRNGQSMYQLPSEDASLNRHPAAHPTSFAPSFNSLFPFFWPMNCAERDLCLSDERGCIFLFTSFSSSSPSTPLLSRLGKKYCCVASFGFIYIWYVYNLTSIAFLIMFCFNRFFMNTT